MSGRLRPSEGRHRMRIRCYDRAMPMRATTIRFSDDLWDDLEREAQSRGVSAAQFIRDSALLRLGAASPDAVREVTPASGGVAQAVADPARLRALRDTELLDTPASPAFDRLTRLAIRVLPPATPAFDRLARPPIRFPHPPIALVPLVDADRQFFKSCLGLPEPWASRRGSPLTHSFCPHAGARPGPLVRDA